MGEPIIQLSEREALEELVKRKARTDLLSFMRYCWGKKMKFVVGRHTREICDRLTKATYDWREGKSTHLLFEVPFRHGKSDIISRFFPAWFLGVCYDMEPDIIMTGYGASLVSGFSKRTKEIILSESYQELFPGLEFKKGSNTAKKWQLKGSTGTTLAMGLGGSITGEGGHLIICDDFCRKRSEAASRAFRDKMWDGWRNDLFTRQNSPACLFVLCGTAWHIDDLYGRIKKSMDEDPEFAQFEIHKFPARKEGKGGYKTLFPERFSDKWYSTQRAVLGKQAAALLDCEPVVEGGNRFNVANLKLHYTLDDWPQMKETRGWDLASSSKERDKDDPDYTTGVRGHVRKINMGFKAYKHEIWIRSIVAIRAEAPERDALIRTTAISDGRKVAQYVESFGAYKDAYSTLKKVLAGVSTVFKSTLPGDKSAKLADLEPSFDNADVHIYVPGCEKYLDLWKTHFMTFPDGDHDDFCDSTAIMFHSQVGELKSTMVIY